MLKTTLFAVLAFSGVQAVDISSKAQIEMGFTAMCDVSAAEAISALTSGPGSCGPSDVSTQHHKRIVKGAHRAYKRALRSGD